MTDLRQLAERALELSKKATVGPWSYSRCYGVATIETVTLRKLRVKRWWRSDEATHRSCRPCPRD